MANAKQCDRCKKLYHRPYASDLVIKRYMHGHGDIIYDLCDECENDLEKFILNGMVSEPEHDVTDVKRENKTLDQFTQDMLKNCRPEVGYGTHIDLKK